MSVDWKHEVAFSATKIADKRLCKRKYAWSVLDGIPRAPNPAAELGTRVHEILERWLRDGTVIDSSTLEGSIAASGVQHLPIAGTHVAVEEWIQLETDVAIYNGKVDLSYVNPETGRCVVHDHKTTSDLGWAKDEAELRKDPQSIIYAAETMARQGVDEVELAWVYHTTKGKRKSKKVHLVITRDEVEAGLKEVDTDAAEMLDWHARGLKAMDLEPTVTACEAFGGCAFRGHCNLTVRDLRKASMAQETTLEKLKREKAERAAAASGGVPANGASGPAAPAPAAPAPAAAAAPRTPPAPAPKPPGINPPAHGAPVAGIDLSPLVAALKELAAKHAPIDLRDQIVLAFCSSGNPDVIAEAYALADEILSKRGGK
jgi:hypothetical protein